MGRGIKRGNKRKMQPKIYDIHCHLVHNVDDGAHDIDDEHPPAEAVAHGVAGTGTCGRVVGGTDDLLAVAEKIADVLFLPDVVACRDDVGTRTEQCLCRGNVDAVAGRRVFAVDHDEVRAVFVFQWEQGCG